MTNVFREQYTLPTDTNELPNLPTTTRVQQRDHRLFRMRQGVSSDSDEQVGSLSQSTVTQTNTDKDEMEVVDEEDNVEYEEEDVRDDDDMEEEEDVLDENEEEGEEDDDEDGPGEKRKVM